IEEIIESKYFNSQLKEIRDTRESRLASDALSGNNRSGNSARDTVAYWLDKGQLPPPYMKQLRRDVVNERTRRDTDGEKFTNNPVIS
ncbi:hypothetical protein, partial [Escherichia coli]|uniref:hypothetical protein n=1 Tax=Escherichia coli TaxID=562 RepID=UPI001BC90B1C